MPAIGKLILCSGFGHYWEISQKDKSKEWLKFEGSNQRREGGKGMWELGHSAVDGINAKEVGKIVGFRTRTSHAPQTIFALPKLEPSMSHHIPFGWGWMMPEGKVGGRRKCAGGFYWPIHPKKNIIGTMDGILYKFLEGQWWRWIDGIGNVFFFLKMS